MKLQQPQQNNGFVIIASKDERYIHSAHHLIESILDFYPEAKIHLFTEERFLPAIKNLSQYIDKVTTDIPSHYRTKLWALDKTFYDNVAYLDADMLCCSDEICNTFDLIGKNDIVFTKIREEAGATTWWNYPEDSCPHGGMFVYKNSDVTKKFFVEWFDLFKQTYHCSYENWKYHLVDKKYSFENVQVWDQFPLYLLLCDKRTHHFNAEIKWAYIDDAQTDWKWNYITSMYPRLFPEYDINKVVIEHYPSQIISSTGKISYDYL